MTFASGGSCDADRVQAIGDELPDRGAAGRIREDDVDERIPHVRGTADRPNVGRSASARITGSVTSVSISCGLRGHFE